MLKPDSACVSARAVRVADQLAVAEAGVAAAVRLYESSNRARAGVLDAADRRLRG